MERAGGPRKSDQPALQKRDLSPYLSSQQKATREQAHSEHAETRRLRNPATKVGELTSNEFCVIVIVSPDAPEPAFQFTVKAAETV